MRPRAAMAPDDPRGSTAPQLRQAIGRVYGQQRDGALTNGDLFDHLARERLIDRDELHRREPVGRSGARHSLTQRRLRWYQQDLRRMGLLERDPARRGVWRLTGEGRRQFVRPAPKTVLLAFSTDLGVALWGACEDVFTGMESEIALALTSPPYPLAKTRAYGNVGPQQYVDFICKTMEPIARALRRGGSIVLNVSQDIFEPGTPARSTYLERMVIALCDRLGLHLVDRLVWHNPAKPPGPVQWASIRRVALNVAWEPAYWFTNDPHALRSDNRRVLRRHTERHAALVASGGESRQRRYSDGAYSLRSGRSFSNATDGAIPRNVLRIGHACAGQQRYKEAARRLGLPAHGAPMPEALAEFVIRFLTEEGDLVADPFAGSCTTAAVAERLGRRWICSELVGEYLRGGAMRLADASGFELHDDLTRGLAQRDRHPTWDGQQPLLLEG